jgi:hypothetical protein
VYVAEAVIAADFPRDRQTVFEHLDRLGVRCLDVASRTILGRAGQPLSHDQAAPPDMMDMMASREASPLSLGGAKQRSNLV